MNSGSPLGPVLRLIGGTNVASQRGFDDIQARVHGLSFPPERMAMQKTLVDLLVEHFAQFEREWQGCNWLAASKARSVVKMRDHGRAPQK